MGILRLLLLGLCLCCAAPAMAQIAPAPAGELINRSSPRDTYLSFLAATRRLEDRYAEYVQDKSTEKLQLMRRDLARTRRLFDLSAQPPSTQVKVGNAAIGYLYDILARLPSLDPESIPGANAALAPLPAGGTADAPASVVVWTIPETDIQISLIESGANRGAFVFSAETVANLAIYHHDILDSEILQPRIYDSFHEEQINAAGPLIPARLIASLPEVLKTPYFETPAWKILLVAVLLCGFAAASLGWAVFASRVSIGRAAPARAGWRISVPLVVLALVSLGEWLIAAQINPAGSFAASELMLTTAIQYLCLAFLVWHAVSLIADVVMDSPRFQTFSFDRSLLRLAARILAIVLFAVVVAIGADKLGIPALGLAAGLGVGGVAIALAAQSTLDNLFSGVSLFADRPFHIGDMIELGDQTGTVEWIGPRSSRLRRRDGTLCTIPNSDLARNRIVNLSKRDGCFIDQTFSIKAGCAPAQVSALLARLRRLLEANPLVEQKEGWPRAHLVGTFPGRMDIRIQARVLTLDYHVFLAEQEALILAALAAMDDNGIDLAAPFTGLSQQH